MSAYDKAVDPARDLASVHDARLLQAASALDDNEVGVAEPLLRGYLKEHPADINALRMYAEVALRLGRYEDAERLFQRCLQLAPDFLAARNGYAIVLHHMNRAPEMLAQTELLLKEEPDSPNFRNLHAAALVRVGDFARAIELYEMLVKDHPDQFKIWLSFGHALKAEGRLDKSIAAYRKCIALRPDFGEAYWSLADIKTLRFAPVEIQGMRAELGHDRLTNEDAVHLHFALGKALEDEGKYAEIIRALYEGQRGSPCGSGL